jgi:hypothetical protein
VLKRGDSVPHFEVSRIDGRSVRYAEIWQRKILLLVVLPATEAGSSGTYAAALAQQVSASMTDNVECVITSDEIPGIPPPSVVVADRWGEVAFIASTRATADLPKVDDLIEWLHFVPIRCPECEGESR